MGGLAIIANPNAHRNRLWPLAAQALRKAAPGVPILETRGPKELLLAVQQIALERPRVLAIAGGDGTVTHTVTALAAVMGNDLPKLALLGGGAYDSLAPLGGPGDAEGRLRRLAEALSTGVPLESTERDTLRVEGRCGFRLGVGLPLRFVEAVYASRSTGPWRSAALLGRALLSSLSGSQFSRQLYAPLDLRVSLDGEEWPRVQIFGLVCATVAEAGLGLRPFRRATEQPGAFEVLGLTAGPRKLALELPRLMLGLGARRDRLLDGVAEQVEVRAPRSFGWFLDGEVYSAESGSLRIELGPRVCLVHA